MNKKPRQVIAAVIRRDRSFLVCKRPAHKHHGGKWEFPGGKLEEGESFFEAAQRELCEELGLQVLSIGDDLFTIVDPGAQVEIHFIDVAVQGEPIAHEHEALSWEALGSLFDLDLAPSDRAFVHFLQIKKS